MTIRRFNPAIPPSLEAIVAKCLAVSPDDRYADAESLAKDLERFLNHQPLLSTHPSRRELMGNYLKRQRQWAARVSLIGVVILIMGFALPGQSTSCLRLPLRRCRTFRLASKRFTKVKQNLLWIT